jgi:hypothetical protein
MKKCAILVFFSLVLVLLSPSCHRPSAIKQLGIQFDTLHADTTALLLDTAMSPKCEVSLDIITFKGERFASVNDSVLRSGVLPPDYLSLSSRRLTPREAVDSFIRKYVADYQSFYAGIFTDEQDTAALNTHLKVCTSVIDGCENVVSYLAKIRSTQGSLSNEYTVVKNIDMRTGRIVRLGDIFVPGYERGLHEAIANQLGKQATIKGIDHLRGAGFFVNSEVYATPNFILGPKAITFVYVEGEIADREKGEISVEVDYGQLKHIMKR